MEIVRSLEANVSRRPTVLTMGKFDGVHLGHRRLINTAVERAAALHMQSAVLTWEPHPSVVLRPDAPVQRLTSIEEKIELIAALGADMLIVAPFTAATKATGADAYMRQITAAVPLRELWVGEDFAMGRGRSGDVTSLIAIGRDLGFTVGAVRKVLFDGQDVSASRVRELLWAADTAAAAQLLGRPFGLRGTVVQGDQRGRTIGFPTANLALAENHLLPANGVYACRVDLGDSYVPAVTNIGVRPTFDGLRRTVEAHLLDWDGDLYGHSIRVDLIQPLRGERKFNGIEELVAQIGRDVAAARQVLAATE
ncbi:MAG: bifunctional riboflavin kinase/FAD synthetase [Oscillochloris sp.]|nr:bifunctional riboflavin kinase/FAD synthetase [Oscillochloris sp.]